MRHNNQPDLASGTSLSKQPGASNRLIEWTNAQSVIVEQSFEPAHNTAVSSLTSNDKRDLDKLDRLGEQNTGH